ncbi:MAG: glycosyltransferase family 2 protein [Candidatus Micrarchaeaceae archaeon]
MPSADKGLISIVIPTYNRPESLCRLLDSIKAQKTTQKMEVLVIDGSPLCPTRPLRKRYGWVRFIAEGREQSLSDMRNTGIAKAKGSKVFLVDDDNKLDANCVQALANALDQSQNIGMAVPYMYYLTKPNVLWSNGSMIGKHLLTPFALTNKVDTGEFEVMRVDTAPNAFMLSRQAIQEVGYFDTANFPIHHAEADYGLRLRKAGFMCVAVPKAKTWHDIGYEKRFGLDIRNDKRAYNIMFGEVMLRKKWQRGFWQHAEPFIILGVMLFITLRSPYVPLKAKLHYMRKAIKGYRDAKRARLIE